MRRLLVFSAAMVAILLLSAVGASANDPLTVTVENPAHFGEEALTVTIDPDQGDVSVTDAIFINNPGADGEATINTIDGSGADVVIEIKVRYLEEGGTSAEIVYLLRPNTDDGPVICIPGTPGCD